MRTKKSIMEYMGKKMFLIAVMFILPLAFCACGSDDTAAVENGEDEEKKPEVVVSAVTNLKAEQTLKANELKVSWNAPSEAAMVEIACWPEKGAEKDAVVTNVRGKREEILSVSEYGSYKVSAVAIDNYGRRSEKTVTVGTPRKENAPTRFEQTGDRMLIADPYCFYHEGKYYAYGTQYATGFPVYTSTDLEHWVESRAMQNTDSWGSNKTTWWAPEVYHYNGLFYMFYVIDEHVCVAYSTSGPTGPFVQSDKKPLIPEEKNIDPHLFVDDNGTPYLYYVRFTGGNVIWVAELNKDLKSIKEETRTECIRAEEEWETKQGTICEGPSIIKKDGVYYLLYSANHYQCKDYAVGYATSDSPLGPWKKYEGNPILRRDNPAAGGLAGVGHGAPFKDADGNWRYIFHAHEFADKNEVGKRSSYINNLHFSADGKISISGELIRPVIGKKVVVED